ncbi:MAG: thioredoxin family protein [Flavobacterium sp.]
MSKEVISEIANRNAFMNLLQHNTGLIVLKLGAKWCGPCKLIEPAVHGFFASSPPEVICGDIDIDVSFDLYAFLKSKKMVNGIPVILCYKKGNATYIPDDSVTGSDPTALHQFFTRCGKHLMDALSSFPKP